MYSIDDKEYPCTTSLAMRYIGGKWKSVILIHLIFGELRYNEIKKVIPTITERALSLQLKQLEDDGLVQRIVYTDKAPLKVGYSLTEFGKTLIPILKSIAAWGKMVSETNDAVNVSGEVCEIGSNGVYKV